MPRFAASDLVLHCLCMSKNGMPGMKGLKTKKFDIPFLQIMMTKGMKQSQREFSQRMKTADKKITNIWPASWQNQQNDCAPSEDSVQPGHPPSLIRVFAVSLGIRPVWTESSLSAQWVAKGQSFLHADRKTLIRLGGCPGWSESSLGTQATLLVLSWGGSFLADHKRSCIP